MPSPKMVTYSVTAIPQDSTLPIAAGQFRLPEDQAGDPHTILAALGKAGILVEGRIYREITIEHELEN